MKKIMLTGALLLGGLLISSAQVLEFTMSNPVPVGCYNAKPITDGCKKIAVDLSGGMATFSLQSINCKKDFKGENLGVINESTKSTAYYDENGSKGVIVEGQEKLILFEKKENSFEIIGVGHVDKKTAKTLDIEKEKSTYSASVASMNNLIEAAKIKKKEAEMAAKMAKHPTTEFKDEYDISGVYYLSRTARDEKNDKYVNTVNLEFLPASNVLKIHYHEGLVNEAFIESIYRKSLQAKTLSYIYFLGDNMNSVKCFANHTIIPLEKDVYYVAGGAFGTDTRLDCSSVKFITQNDKDGNVIRDYTIMGKDKQRVEELAKNHELLETLLKKSLIEMCEAYNVVRAGRNPMPGEGRIDNPLTAEAFTLVKQHAAEKNWPQKLEYCYIKSPDWTIIRNKITGVILSRSTRVILVMTSNGKCMWEEFEIRQDYDGTKFGKTYFYGNSANIVPAECTDAMRYKKK